MSFPPLTVQQLHELRQVVVDAENDRVRRRAEAIKLVLQGQSTQEVAEAVGVSVPTIRAWLRRYQNQGPDGIRDRPRSGRPRKANKHCVDLLEAALAETPFDMGYDHDEGGWTVSLLRDFMKRETGIRLSDGRMRALLHHRGYTYRPAPSLLDRMLPPFPKDYADIKVWLKLEEKLRAQLPERQCRPLRTWVKMSEEDRLDRRTSEQP